MLRYWRPRAMRQWLIQRFIIATHLFVDSRVDHGQRILLQKTVYRYKTVANKVFIDVKQNKNNYFNTQFLNWEIFTFFDIPIGWIRSFYSSENLSHQSERELQKVWTRTKMALKRISKELQDIGKDPPTQVSHERWLINN